MKPSSTIKVATIALIAGAALFMFLTIGVPLNYNLRRDTYLVTTLSGVAFFAAHAVPDLALGGWAIVTAVGLRRHRLWARVSIIALSFCAIYVSLGWAQVVLLTSIPGASVGTRLFPVDFALVPTGVGGVAVVWVAQFADKGMDEVFRAHGSGGIEEQHLERSRPDPGGKFGSSRIPLSFSVIAAWLLVVWPIGLYQRLFTPRAAGVPFPAYPFGVVLFGHPLVAYLVAITATGAAVGLGLLRVRNWARVGAATLCLFSVASTLAMAIRPNAFGRVASVLHLSGVSLSPSFFWIGTLWDVWLPAAALYFLITRKASLEKAQEGHTP